MNASSPLVADPVAVRAHLARLHACAGTALAGLHQPGMMQLVRIHPGTQDTLTFRFAIGEVDHMVDEAVRQANAGFNVYVEGRTVSKTASKRGSLADTVGVFGLTVDADADKGKGSRIEVEPSMVVETSPGNAHHWFLLDRALPANQAKRLGEAIRAKVGGDSDTGVVTQPYRVAGTPNFPGKAKIARGRVATQTRILDIGGRVWTAEELLAAFPESEKPKAKARPNAAFSGETGSTGRTSPEAEALAAETDVPKRWPQFFAAAKAAYADGLSPDDFEALIRRYPEGCGGKFLEPYDRLRREVQRAWGYVQAKADTVGQVPAEPTYPDRRQPVAEAQRATAEVIEAFFSENVPTHLTKLQEWKVALEGWQEAKVERVRDLPERPPMPEPTSWGARIETAIGKTELAIQAAAQAAKDGYRVVYSAPMHALLGEISERFQRHGVKVRVYRGYETADPETEGLSMCLDLPAMRDAREAGRRIRPTACTYSSDGLEYRCKFMGACGMERQRAARPRIWLVPHALLLTKKPTFIPVPNAIVIDESIAMAAVPDKPERMSLDAIRQADIRMANELFAAMSSNANDLDAARGRLLRALDDHAGDGPLQREILIKHGVTNLLAGQAQALEEMRMRDPGIRPGMDAKDRKVRLASVGPLNAEARRLSDIWGELRVFLSSDAEASGRLRLRYDTATTARMLECRSLRQLGDGWHAPALLLDATLPPAELLTPVLGHPVEVRADITARWSEHVSVRQIAGAPVSATKLGIVEGKEPETPRRSVGYLMRLIRLRAALAVPRSVVVIGPKKLVGLLKAAGLPENVETGHFGAVAGIDHWRDAAGLICIGRLQPGPLDTEAMAGVITGRVPPTVAPIDGKGDGVWYPKVDGGIRLADGTGVWVEQERHPDPIVDALRWQVTEAGLIQAIGRLRALRRTAATPAFLDIVSDVPLPISVDRVVPWHEALPSAWANMAPAGVLLESEADIMAAFPDLAPTRDAARANTVATSGVTSIGNILIGLSPILATVFEYKRRGRFEPASGYLLPNRPSDLHGWLSDRLQGLDWLKVDGVEERAPDAPEADGVVLDSPADMAAAWPARWATTAAARDWRTRNGGIKLQPGAVRFRYQREGRNQKWRTGTHDPARVPDLRAWLENRLGPLAGLELPDAPQAAAEARAARTAAGSVNPLNRRPAPRQPPGTATPLSRAPTRPRGPHFRAPLSPTAATFF
ncbi:hypothetical protein [Methylobacterium brachiatum]